jgi:hypothetical protein
MIKSTKPEREAVIARLKDALKTINDSELKVTLDALEDLNALEEKVVTMCELYEKSIVEDYKINYMGPKGPTFTTSKMQESFFWTFNNLEEFCRNHHRVQRAMRATDSEIARLSQGDKALVRGKGIATAPPPSLQNIVSPQYIQSVLGTPRKHNGTTVATPPNSAPNNQAGGTQKASPTCSKCGASGKLNPSGMCFKCDLRSILNGSSQKQQVSPNFTKSCSRCGGMTNNAGMCNACLQSVLNTTPSQGLLVPPKCKKCSKAPCEKGSTFCFNCNNTCCALCPTIIGALNVGQYCSHCLTHVSQCAKCKADFVHKSSAVYTSPVAQKSNPMFSDSTKLCKACYTKQSIASKIIGFMNKSLDDVL